MMVRFQPLDLPIAYSMITAAKKLKRQDEEQHPYQKYFYYWAAFNNIYTTVAYSGSRSTTLKHRPDGTIDTRANGSVQIPKVKTVSEQEQIDLTLTEFDDKLKHRLIVNESTEFFVNRTPSWNGKKIITDTLGQKLNGVLNVNYTVDARHPFWSPIDTPLYSQYLANSKDVVARNFLAKQIVDLLYTVRCNLMHGSKKYDDRNDVSVVGNALPLLTMIVSAFTR